MDPVTLILTALGTGAATSSQAIADDVIKDAYAGLKSLIQRKFTGKSNAEIALREYESDPITWEAPLKKALIQSQVDRDEDIIKTAQRLMTHVNPQQASMGKFNLQITGDIQGFNQGDHNIITQHFNNSSER